MRFSFTSVEHRRTHLPVSQGKSSRVVIEIPSSGKRGLGRSCSHGRNSSRQVNLPRGSFNPVPTGCMATKKKSTLFPFENCHARRFAFRFVMTFLLPPTPIPRYACTWGEFFSLRRAVVLRKFSLIEKIRLERNEDYWKSLVDILRCFINLILCGVICLCQMKREIQFHVNQLIIYS